jgi:hypothetical protein
MGASLRKAGIVAVAATAIVIGLPAVATAQGSKGASGGGTMHASPGGGVKTGGGMGGGGVPHFSGNIGNGPRNFTSRSNQNFAPANKGQNFAQNRNWNGGNWNGNWNHHHHHHHGFNGSFAFGFGPGWGYSYDPYYYGPDYYYGDYAYEDDCGLQRRVYYRHGHRYVRWVRVCY